MKTTLVVLLLLLSSSAGACWQQEDRNVWDCQTELLYRGDRDLAWYVQPTSIGYFLQNGDQGTLNCANTDQLVTGQITLETRIGVYSEIEQWAVYCQPPPRPVELEWWELWTYSAACYYGFSYCYYDPWQWDYY